MKILLLLSLFLLSLGMESNFEIQHSNWDDNKIMESLRRIGIEVEASFGENLDTYKLILDIHTQAIVLPGVETDVQGISHYRQQRRGQNIPLWEVQR